MVEGALKQLTTVTEIWRTLARASTPDGAELVLRQRGGDFEIRFSGWELMSSRTSVSEQALARLTCQALGRAPRRVLVGGLGMGYTLRAMLDAADANARIVVAELVPSVVDWVRGPLAHLAGHPLEDPRVEVCVGSVVDVLSAAPDRFDAALLDTDNGPEAVVHESNRFLYSRAGLELTKKAMTVGAVIGYWAADRSASFEQTLDAASMKWRRVDIDARVGGGGPQHSIYLTHPF
jgi:spermidine synthase